MKRQQSKEMRRIFRVCKNREMVAVIQQGSDRKAIDVILAKLFKKRKGKGIDAKRYCGVLTLKEDALELQRTMRDEW